MKKKIKKHKHIYKKAQRYVTIPNVIVAVTTGLLIVSVLAEIFVPTYHTNPLLYGLMGTVVGLTIRSINK